MLRRSGLLGGALFLSATAVLAQTGAVTMVESPRARVVLLTPALSAAVDFRQTFIELTSSCRRVMRVDTSTVSRLVAASAFAAPLDARQNAAAIIVLPRPAGSRACPRVPEQTRLAESRGVYVASDTSYTRERDIERVELRIEGRVLTPLATEKGFLQLLTPRGLLPTRSGVVRLLFDLDSLAPDATGMRASVELHVWNRADPSAERVTIPWSALEPLWLSALGNRSDRSAAAGLEDGTRVALEDPVDPDLVASRRAYLSGDLSTANRFLLSRLGEGELKRREERTSLLQLGATFASLGDTSASRVIFANLLRSEPCLTFSEDSPAIIRRLTDPLARSPARCTSTALPLVALRAAALPGYGRPVAGWREGAARALVGAAIGTAVLTGLSQRDASRASYAAYQSATTSPEAERLYSLAESQRASARARFATAAAVWGASIAEAIVREFLHERRLARVRGVAPTLESAP